MKRKRLSTSDLIGRVTQTPTRESIEAALREYLADPYLSLVPAPQGRRAAEAEPPSFAKRSTAVHGTDGEYLGDLHLSVRVSDKRFREAVALCRLGLVRLRELDSSQRAVSDAVKEAVRAERRRIERDLHDGFQQTLLAASLHLSAARVDESVKSGENDHVASAAAYIRTSLDELRRFTHGLRPVLLAQLGLHEALSDVCVRLNLKCNFQVPPRRWPEEIEETLYYIAAEALSNVAKHAQATTVDVSVEELEGSIRLTVVDDGVGIVSDAQRDGEGLRGIYDRASSARGTADIASVRGEGTKIAVALPLG